MPSSCARCTTESRSWRPRVAVDVLRCLSTVWGADPETASGRLRGQPLGDESQDLQLACGQPDSVRRGQAGPARATAVAARVRSSTASIGCRARAAPSASSGKSLPEREIALGLGSTPE